MLKHILTLAIPMLLAAGHADAAAYTPDIAEFDGSNGFVFPPSDQFDFISGGTIEFWVAADWRADPGYDPVAVSNTGPDGSSYLVAVNGARDGLVVNAGDRIEVVPFDFSDGKLHHVAVVDTGGETYVMVDATVVGEMDLSFADLESSGFWVGSANGKDAPFIGAIGGLRLWSIAVDPLTLATFSRRDIDDPDDPHPDLDFLMAESDFDHQTILVNVVDAEDADTAADR